LTEVPVMVAAGWTKTQIQAYAIADNKLALNAGWDEAILALEIGELQEAGFEIDLTGFDLADIAALNSRDTGGLTDPDETPRSPRRSGFDHRRRVATRPTPPACAATARWPPT